jgi:hypothetical protein
VPCQPITIVNKNRKSLCTNLFDRSDSRGVRVLCSGPSVEGAGFFKIGAISTRSPWADDEREPSDQHLKYDASYTGRTILHSAYATTTSKNCKTLDPAEGVMTIGLAQYRL